MYDGATTKATLQCRHCKRQAKRLRSRGLCNGCYMDLAVRHKYPKDPSGDARRRTHCRRCGKKANRPKGLCWSCYYTPGVRDLYSSESKFARRGPQPSPGARRMPQPTQALPGTEAKLNVLAERLARGVDLWHPADARRDA